MIYLNFYIGNTSLTVNKKNVSNVLVKCAAELEGNPVLRVLEVEEAGVDLPNRRSKCWKVTVPYGMKSLMENSNIYPIGWSHRRFFERSNGNKRTKISNPRDRVLDAEMKEVEEKQASQMTEEEDPRFRSLVEEKARQLVLAHQQLPSSEGTKPQILQL